MELKWLSFEGLLTTLDNFDNHIHGEKCNSLVCTR